ncbi:MAG: nucleotide exchange factor GrpE [Chloroflexi bacterium]|nr:nucleotide exchange factor GrpE [Chloroflexota bacterium]
MTDKNEKRVRIPVTSQGSKVAGEQGSKAEEDELEAIRQEVAEYKDKYLRAAAEMENTRKRLERRYADQAEEEKKRLLRTFLAVADNLERALTHSDYPPLVPPASQGGSLRDGVKLTYQELQRLLSLEGVEPLEAIGQPFDPYYHEAVDTVVGDDDPETVVGERQKGYLYRGELLRPAKVEVAIPALR